MLSKTSPRSPLVALPLLLALLPAPRGAAAEAQAFASPQEAAHALVEASRHGDEAALRRLVDEEHASLVLEADDPAIDERRKRFAEGADARLEYREEGPDRVMLVVGFEAYPFPLPLVRSERGWQFDSAAGAEEIIDRTVGMNELTAISVLNDYVEAQQRYAAEPRDELGVRRFASRFLSTPGKRDGLYWETGEDQEPSPFGPSLGQRGQATRDAPYYGYRYRILTRQGASAPGGAYSYVINGNLVAGFAAVAWPAEYGRTGVMTFVVNHYGTVYEKDLGPDTEKLGAAIQAYAPDESWREAE
jgi:Protein of unknown function (DUF2950)